jgi:hypothetical protein
VFMFGSRRTIANPAAPVNRKDEIIPEPESSDFLGTCLSG